MNILYLTIIRRIRYKQATSSDEDVLIITLLSLQEVDFFHVIFIKVIFITFY